MAKQEKRPGESIDSILRKFKKKVKDEGLMVELKKREFYEKPSEEKKKRIRAAKRRTFLKQKENDL